MRRLESLAPESATLRAYLQAIARFQAVTDDEERALAERIRNRRDDDALSRLVEAHLQHVVRYARRYLRLGVPLLDLIHGGNLALIDAARRFDPDRHGAFATYSAWWVRQGIMHRLSEGDPDWNGGDGVQPVSRQVEALQVALEHSLSPGASDGDLTDEDVRRLDADLPSFLNLAGGASLDLDDVVEVAAGTDETIEDEGVRAALLGLLESSLVELEPRERRVLEQHFGLRDGEPRTIAQVGRRLGIPAEKAARLATRGVRTLRRQRWLRSALN